jgi:uncharacterized protein YcaQ
MSHIAEQHDAILAQLRRHTGAYTVYELRDMMAARRQSSARLGWLKAETLQRRLRELAAAGKVTIYERLGPNGAHCYELRGARA